MAKDKMRDLVLLLPGITGSVLRRDDKDLWAISGQTLWSALRHRRELIESLKLPPHKPGETAPDDGVRATAVIHDFHGVFGFWKIDGYDTTARIVTDNFDVTQGTIQDPHENENFFEFPYDWRRSNRDSAAVLDEFLGAQLERWRRWSGWDKRAKIILLAHSMGGLVARYCLEALGRWPDCRALITFGTPFRGSLNALDYVANGFSKAGIDLTAVMRSMPSVYELMPSYESIKVGGEWKRVAEADGLPAEIERGRAADALRFHREIEAAVSSHDKTGYSITAVVGVEQPTLQSANLDAGRLVTGFDLPRAVEEPMRGGDGTVPRFSAIPLDFGRTPPRHVVETHGSLQNNDYVLDDLYACLQWLQTDAIRGDTPSAAPSKSAQKRAVIALAMEDLFLREEPVVLRAELTGGNDPTAGLRAHINSTTAGARGFTREFVNNENRYELCMQDLDPGQYHVAVSTVVAGPGAPTPVHTVFEIADAR